MTTRSASYTAAAGGGGGGGIADLEGSVVLDSSLASITNTPAGKDQVCFSLFICSTAIAVFEYNCWHDLQSSSRLLREIADLRKINAQLEVEISRLKDEATIQLMRHREEVKQIKNPIPICASYFIPNFFIR